MKFENLHKLLMDFQRASRTAKTQADFDVMTEELKKAISKEPNGPQIVALIDWSPE